MEEAVVNSYLSTCVKEAFKLDTLIRNHDIMPDILVFDRDGNQWLVLPPVYDNTPIILGMMSVGMFFKDYTVSICTTSYKVMIKILGDVILPNVVFPGVGYHWECEFGSGGLNFKAGCSLNISGHDDFGGYFDVEGYSYFVWTCLHRAIERCPRFDDKYTIAEA